MADSRFHIAEALIYKAEIILVGRYTAIQFQCVQCIFPGLFQFTCMPVGQPQVGIGSCIFFVQLDERGRVLNGAFVIFYK